MSTQWKGTTGSPIPLRTNAPRQTEEARYRQPTRKPIEADDAWNIPKSHTSAYTYPSDLKKTRVIPRRRFDRTTFVIWLCLGLIVMIGGWMAFNALSNWWQGVQDDWKYGNPRTYQTDQFVGQGDSPDHPDHFIVVNTHGQVIVVQINPQHPQLDHICGITTASDPKVPVSLNFRPTGNTWAMYVIIGDTTPYSVELVSDGKQFVSPH